MKRILSLLIACYCIAIVSSSCRKNFEKGEGSIRTETRVLSAFNKIEVELSAEVYIYNSTKYEVVVSDYQNLIPLIKTEVNGTKLCIDAKNFTYLRNSKLRIDIYTPAANQININGSATLVYDEVPGLSSLDITINGNGDISLSKGSATNATYKINGSGNIKAAMMKATYVKVDISGSGDVRCYAERELDIEISGSGDVYYLGNPVVHTSISGSGNIHKM
ncbi:MAG: DUF2807 domain-containing protein [Bacteroidetes bacterium]|nr:DUF2807 domain-containing protein [Bacteroidota bacterium]